MLKKLFIISIALACCHLASVHAQSITPDVTPTAGGYFTGGGNSISWTMGETFTSTLQNGSVLVSQGEQQPELDILTVVLASGSICAGNNITVLYTAKGYYGPSNVFTAELSDATGSFAAPVSIGTLLSQGSGSIIATIPPGTPSGAGYLVRVVSNLPVYIGKDNGTNINIIGGAATTLSGNTNLCAGGVIGLIATGGNQYQWSGPNGFTANSGGSITRTNANVTMSGTYTVTVTNNDCIVVLSIGVTVHPLPVATLSGATSVCSGGTISLTAPAGATSYQWSGPNGFISNTGNTNSLTRTNATTTMGGLYKVTVTNAGGCTATASRSVSVNAPTTATVTGATSICSNANVVLTATTAGVAYEWTGPSGFTAGTATINTPAVAGQYKVTVTNALGCISTASKTVTVNAVPLVSITGNVVVCTGSKIYLIASGGNSYYWSGPNSFTQIGSVVNRNAATVTMSGLYTVTVTGSGGCSASASVVVTVTDCKTGAEELNLPVLSAYPNPTEGATNITFTASGNEQVRLSVFNVEGKEVAVLFNEVTKALTQYEFELDMSPLPSGTYYAVLNPANGPTQQIRLMIVR